MARARAGSESRVAGPYLADGSDNSYLADDGPDNSGSITLPSLSNILLLLLANLNRLASTD